MKKSFLFLFILSFAISIFAKIDYENHGNNLVLNYENLQKSSDDIYKVIAFPSRHIELNVLSFSAKGYDENGKAQADIQIDPQQFIKLADEFVMREFYGHEILIKNKIDLDKGGHAILSQISIKVTPAGEMKTISKISKAFLPAYKALADNFNYSYLRNVDFSNPKILIISQSALSQYIEVYSQWKKQKGTEVILTNVEDIGTSTTEIKNYIQSQYNTPNPPDYLLLIGDVDGSYVIPSYYVTEENDVTDQLYTELEGNDYFPEMIVGRISIDQLSEFITVINKILHYEKIPYLDETDWLKHVVVVAGNYSPSPPFPSTPVSTSQWMADNFRNHGFTDVTEIYYPPTYPGTNEIHSAINQGAAFVTYRGWGDANGWHFPEYHIGEGTETGVIDLSNGYKLPIVTSIVCHTGDFANTLHDPCFGEAWLRAGTATNPKGGVAFIGPSDLHTHTKFNNAIYGGFYAGVLDEGIYDFGAAVLRGKIELYNNFPLNQAPAGLVEFYFRVYNILGDPNIQMWTDIPQEISCEIPSAISIGTNSLTLNLPDMEGAIVTALKDDENLFERATVQNGTATLYLNMQNSGTLTLTVTYPNKVPLISEIDVQQQAIDLGITDIQTNDDIISGNTTNINITIKNYGSQTAQNITGVLSSESEYITINTSSANFGDIQSGETSTQTFEISVSGNCPNNQTLPFTLDINGTNAKFELIANGLAFVIDGYEISNGQTYISPGETADITFHFKNCGIFTVNNLNILAEGTDAFGFGNNTATISSIEPGEIGNATFTVSVASDCAVGRILGFNFTLEDDANRIGTSWYHIVAGNVTNTAPTGPDNFGYYAYDSFDTNYSLAPTYQWVEIDPTEGGSGTLIEMTDDQVETVNLPFTFKYYDVDYNQISICSNGWLSFIPTEEVDFINWNIPAYLGPYAMVAPYWDDLLGEDLGNDQYAPMNISYYHDTTNHKFIVEWNKCYSRFDHVSPEIFQVILFDPQYHATPDGNGKIQFNYHNINNPDANNNYATVGIENHLQNDGVLYTFASQYPPSATELQNNLSILFTTEKPDNYTHSNSDNLPSLKSSLIGNYPNPFNPETKIEFFVKNSIENIKIIIFNIKGEKVTTLVDNKIKQGKHSVIWHGKNKDGKGVTSGVYFIVLKSNDKILSSKKAILLK